MRTFLVAWTRGLDPSWPGLYGHPTKESDDQGLHRLKQVAFSSECHVTASNLLKSAPYLNDSRKQLSKPWTHL